MKRAPIAIEQITRSAGEPAAPRVIASVHEPFEGKPFDLFVWNGRHGRAIGRKTAATFRAGAGMVSMKSALVTPDMLLGWLESERVCSRGVTLYYRPLLDAEKASIFESLVAEGAELTHPYVRFEGPRREEPCAPDSYWCASDECVEHLTRTEWVATQLTLEVLRGFELDGALVYDPACSTGEFLGTLKRHYPHIRAVGRDKSPSMVARARSCALLDVVSLGDAADDDPDLPQADLMFVRFLNVHVVTTAAARALLPKLASRCRMGGCLIAFGHTPLLLNGADFEQAGFAIEQRVGCLQHPRAAFQYYVLRKVRDWTSTI